MPTPVSHPRRRRRFAFIPLVIAIVMMPATFEAQLDICGCATIPDLPAVDSTTATYLPGWVDDGSNLTIPLPADGIIRLSRLRIQNRQVFFARNAANTPVTFLVAGDFSLISTAGCCYTMNLQGGHGTSGNAATAGVGGQGGPGGFRGGDGASQPINLAAIGGAGFGPAGGIGGTASPLTEGAAGTFMGVPELIPLLGGSGGGGGASSGTGATNCSGGGGGGGGGAILVAANGTLNITNYQLFVDGGTGGSRGNSACSSSGGDGAAGAIRLVARSLTGPGNLYARTGSSIPAGRIRLESIDTSSQTVFTTQPAAQRITGTTPLMNPVAPTVTITSVGGNSIPAVPQGTFGAIDVVLGAPGATGVTLATTGVPGGTTVEVTVKPRIGGAPVSQVVPLTGCDLQGNCQANATFTLNAGAYVVEARATFQVQ